MSKDPVKLKYSCLLPIRCWATSAPEFHRVWAERTELEPGLGARSLQLMVLESSYLVRFTFLARFSHHQELHHPNMHDRNMESSPRFVGCSRLFRKTERVKAMPDGKRKRRFSTNAAKRQWYARWRSLRFARRFGELSVN